MPTTNSHPSWRPSLSYLDQLRRQRRGAAQRHPEVLKENPFVKFFNDERGYVLCNITPQHWTTHYRTVPFVDKPHAPLNTRASFLVEAGRPGLIRV